MPVYTRETLQTDRLPWVDVDDFEIFVLGRNMAIPRLEQAPVPEGHTPTWGVAGANPQPNTRHIVPTSAHERVMVTFGEVSVETRAGRLTLKRRDWLEVPEEGVTLYNYGTTQAELVRVAGRWDSTVRMEICLFTPELPCDYHFHDSDEYWFVFRGHFTLDYHGRRYAMKPGSMLAAGMGFEHGVVAPEEHFQAVVMATQLEGQCRDGHLLREKHGDPTPARDVPDSVLADDPALVSS